MSSYFGCFPHKTFTNVRLQTLVAYPHFLKNDRSETAAPEFEAKICATMMQDYISHLKVIVTDKENGHGLSDVASSATRYYDH